MQDIANKIGALFGQKQRLQDWMTIEAALATCQADMGIIPKEAAADIAAKACVSNIDLARYEQMYLETRHPLVPLLKLYQDAVGASGQYLHFGATTHDIVDIAKILALKQVWDLTEEALLAMISHLADLAERHAYTLQAGRSHNIQSVPITFGFKAAMWADELWRSVERLRQGRERVFVVTFSGASGTMASFDGRGAELEERMAKAFDLGVPDICWHPARDRIAEIASVFAIIGGTLGRIAQEVYLLMATEIRELSEGYRDGMVGSSTMPHKINPINSQHIMGDARTLRYAAAQCIECMAIDHEHNLVHFDDERSTCERIGLTMADLLSRSYELISTLFVDEGHMRQNLDALNGALLSENVMLDLGRRIGKMSAKDIVTELAIRSVQEEASFAALLKGDARVNSVLTDSEIDALLDPTPYAEDAAKVTLAYVQKLRQKLA